MLRAILFLICFNIAAIASPLELAITIDDLPQHMDLPPKTARSDVAKKMLLALKKHSIQHIYGFINAGNIKNNADHLTTLKAWVDAGQSLGNHTYDHVNINEVSSQQFIHQIKMNEPYLAKLMKNKNHHYFRYPYLFEGNTQEKRDLVRKYLASHHYRVAQVTVDFEDYLWNNAYVRCKKSNDNQSLRWLKKTYISEALEAIQTARTQAKLIFKRDIKHILLLHIGVFDALMLDEFLTVLAKHQVKIISLAEALRDKVYRINPDVVSKNTGSFLDQMQVSKKLTTPNVVKKFIAQIPERKIDELCR